MLQLRWFVAFVERTAKLFHKNHQFIVIHFFACLRCNRAPVLAFGSAGHYEGPPFIGGCPHNGRETPRPSDQYCSVASNTVFKTVTKFLPTRPSSPYPLTRLARPALQLSSKRASGLPPSGVGGVAKSPPCV